MFGKVRVALYIDGSNFYHYLKNRPINFPKGTLFDYKAFSDFLIGTRECISRRYYTGIVNNPAHDPLIADRIRHQQKFIQGIRKDGFIVKRGRILHDGGGTREKGVDVKLAVDLTVGAADDLYDVAVLVSSDTDLVPAIKYIQHKKKQIEYVGFEHAKSKGLLHLAEKSIFLTAEDIEKFKRVP
ncbi:MAG: NYN domain-containing protein [Candidatus Levybacteria bacterium]|nr:NYN domain-containing protein [Candidatus Levybacteria bacterium]